MAMQAVLEITAGPQAGRKITLTPGNPLRIGRTNKSEYVMAEDTFLSSAHFAVEWSGESCVLRDLGSSNGTFLNGTRTSESPMQNGDLITAGQSSFELKITAVDDMTTMYHAVRLTDTAAMPAPAFAPESPLPPPPPSLPGPALTAAQRSLLDMMRGLADPIFAVLDEAAAGSFLDEVRIAGGVVEAISETLGACVTSVNPESRIGELLAANGWAMRWGIYVTSRQPIAMVRNHLKRFQTLVTQDGAEFQFRFFRPDLLRSFLPTLNGDEAKTLFGPLSAMFAEGSSADELMLYMPGATGVLEKRMELG